jgi:hypothetical protein
MLREEQALKLKAQRTQMEEADKIYQGFQPQTVSRSNETATDYDTGVQAPDTQSYTQEAPLIKYARQVHGDDVANMAAELAKYGRAKEALALITGTPKYTPIPEGGLINNRTQEVIRGTPKQKLTSVPAGAVILDENKNVVFQNPNKPDKAPAGYRFTGNGDMEAVPGGPADIKGQNAASQAFASLSNANEALNRLEVAVKTLKDHPGLSRITGVMSKLPNMPGSNAANAQALLENIKSQAGFTVLQNMRDMSKTGGALGQVSDFENKMLQANLAALDNVQSTAAFKTALDTIQKYVSGAKTRLQRAYDQSYYGKKSQVTRPTDAAPPVAGARQAGDGNWYVPDPKRPGKYLQVVQ